MEKKGSKGLLSRLDWAACRMWTWTIDSVLILDDLPNSYICALLGTFDIQLLKHTCIQMQLLQVLTLEKIALLFELLRCIGRGMEIREKMLFL